MRAVTAVAATIAFVVAAPLPGCYLVHNKAKEGEGEPSRADSGDSGARSNDSGLAGGNDGGAEGKGKDAAETDSGSDIAIPESDNILEGVEVCLKRMTIGGSSVTQTTLTDRQGRYLFEDPFGDSPEEDVRYFILSAFKFGLKIEPEEVQLEVEEVLARGIVSGIVGEDFTITRIKTGPHAEGQWQVVEYNCPAGTFLEICLEAFDAGTCPFDMCPDPESAIGNVYTFHNGCLFDMTKYISDMSRINCVDGMQYTSGINGCLGSAPTSTGNITGSSSTTYGGYFDEDTQRWHINESMTMMGYPISSSPLPAYQAELVLERVSTSDGG